MSNYKNLKIADPNNEEHMKRVCAFASEIILEGDSADVLGLMNEYGLDVDGESGILYIKENE